MENPEPFLTHSIYINPQIISTDIIEMVNEVVLYTSGSLTTSYGNDKESRLNKIIQQNDVSLEQVNVLRSLLLQIVKIEKDNNTTFNIDINSAQDDEVVISKKSDNGLSLISVNSYGDIMTLCSGYLEKKNINFFEYENYDPEQTVYTFLGF